MNTEKIVKKIRLTDNDKKVIIKNSGVCTDLHGKGCDTVILNNEGKHLN